MSIYRLVTRLATVHALNNYLEEPWPTLAGPNIFDSRIEPIEEMKFDRVFPCVVVYTDYDKNHWPKAKSAHAERLLSITLELLIVQAKTDAPSSSTFRLDCPETDSEIEESLDVLEAQILEALKGGSVASDALQYLCPGMVDCVSRRGASVEGGHRLAARQMTLEMKALRENLTGVIPPAIGAFLDKLEQHDDYRDRVPGIRDFITAPAAASSAERSMRAFGYTRALLELLGSPSHPQVVLPPTLTFQLN